MNPPRLRLVQPGSAVPEDSPDDAARDDPEDPEDPEDPDADAPALRLISPPVAEDRPPKHALAELDALRVSPPVLGDSPPPGRPLVELELRLVSPPVPEDMPPPEHALAELDALLAGALDDVACLRLAALAVQVPGRQRVVAAALGQLASAGAILALRSLPPAAPGVLDALLRCFGRGVCAPLARAPVPGDSPLLALDFRGSRARGFPDLVARGQAIAGRSAAAEFAALGVDGRPHYRLTFWTGRIPAAALATGLRAAHLDLAWLHGRLARLRGSRLWLGGWRFDADDPLGPAVQAHLLQAWLRHAEQAP